MPVFMNIINLLFSMIVSTIVCCSSVLEYLIPVVSKDTCQKPQSFVILFSVSLLPWSIEYTRSYNDRHFHHHHHHHHHHQRLNETSCSKVTEQVNRKCPLGTQCYNFQPLHRPYSFKLPTSWTINVGAIWRMH